MSRPRRGSGDGAGRAPEDDGEERGFADMMDDVEPLAGRDRVRAPDRVIETPVARRAPVEFERPVSDEPLLGYAGGIDRATWRRLRGGQIEPEADIDLHGLRRDEARRALHQALEDARHSGFRCIRVIHGYGRDQGRRRDEERRRTGAEPAPVLKSSLPGWLAEAPSGEWVLAFAPAQPDEGGAGATLVLLRRERSR